MIMETFMFAFLRSVSLLILGSRAFVFCILRIVDCRYNRPELNGFSQEKIGWLEEMKFAVSFRFVDNNITDDDDDDDDDDMIV